VTATAQTFDLDREADIELQELRAIGVNIDDPYANGQAQIDAWASMNLRRMAACDAELDRYSEAMKLELEAIYARYRRLMEPVSIRRNELEAQTKMLAEISHFGNKKSRKVGFGVYGRRTKKGGIVIQDDEMLIAWCTSNKTEEAQQLVTATITTTYPVARESRLLGSAKLSVSKSKLNEYCAKNGAGLPGTTVERDTEECYAKPEPLDAIEKTPVSPQ
jgi:hypothetical protein